MISVKKIFSATADNFSLRKKEETGGEDWKEEKKTGGDPDAAGNIWRCGQQ